MQESYLRDSFPRPLHQQCQTELTLVPTVLFLSYQKVQAMMKVQKTRKRTCLSVLLNLVTLGPFCFMETRPLLGKTDGTSPGCRTKTTLSCLPSRKLLLQCVQGLGRLLVAGVKWVFEKGLGIHQFVWRTEVKSERSAQQITKHGRVYGPQDRIQPKEGYMVSCSCNETGSEGRCRPTQGQLAFS